MKKKTQKKSSKNTKKKGLMKKFMSGLKKKLNRPSKKPVKKTKVVKKKPAVSKKVRISKKRPVAKKKLVLKKKQISRKKVKVLKKKVQKKKISKKKVKVLKKKLKAHTKLVKRVVKKSSKKPARVQKVKTVEVPRQSVQSAPAVQAAVEDSGFTHEPVLIQEVLQQLELADKKVVVDGTLGLGGHSKTMLEQMPIDGKLIGFDVDDDNLARARANLQSFGDRVVFVRSNFSNLQEELKKLGVKGVDAILLDLGLSSPQVDNPVKGFSFLREGPLDMRFDKTQPLTAADVINTYTLKDLMRIFFEFGEERFARKIATEIARRRKARSFKTTTELANFIEKLIGRQGHIHPATRVFQALRIEVNHELDVLLSTLKQAVEVLKKKGRLAVISYHSLEDRVVKQFFKECALEFINEPDKLTTTHLNPTLTILTKKPIVPSESEVSKNPRSRSAKLRVAEKR